MNIPEHRKAIDQLDEQIVKLLNERTKHVLAIGEIKLKAGEEIYAPHRERAVLQRLCKLNRRPDHERIAASHLSRDHVQRAVAGKINDHRLLRARKRHLRTRRPFDDLAPACVIPPQKTIGDVFAEVSKNRADYGVVPVENSTEGVVTHTLDMFVDSDLKIVSQIVLPVQQCLLSNAASVSKSRSFRPSADPGPMPRLAVTRICREVEIIETSSNARSAELAATEKKSRRHLPAFSPPKNTNCASCEHDIQDNAANATRFLVLGRQCSPPPARTAPASCSASRMKSGRFTRPGPIPPLQVQHDENRISSQQAQSLGIFLLRRLRWARPG